MSRVLVTGACGFTGSNMIEALAAEWPDADIVATDLPGSDRGEYYVDAPDTDDPQPVFYEDILEEYDVEFVAADLTNPDDVDEIGAAGPYDTVFHIASLFDYFAPREALYRVNVDGTRNLLMELARQDSPRVIHWSTLGTLGNAGFSEPKDEESGYHPHNRYCESKVSQEQVVRAFEDRLDVTVIRPAPIYGPRHQYGIYHILSLIERMGVAPVWKIYPRSKQLQFPCVHVDDVVGAALHLANTPEAVDETYNVLSDSMASEEVISFIGDELGVPTVSIPSPYPVYKLLSNIAYKISVKMESLARARDTRPPVDAPMLRYLSANMWFSNEKLKAAGYDLIYQDPRDGLRAYIEWCRDHGYLALPGERPSRRAVLRQSIEKRLSI